MKTIRCAIYTRKSTEEGLEQEFNSLDAQRESGEAYITSQKSEGWLCLPEQYNDGGFSGGNMSRPALARLLSDIDAGLVDCVVVYKVDRLSRSLMDFSRILEQFEAKKVSFVSVTQQFNTTNSMGRLTLNILLSFAQFEREVISERTRDKIALSRKRGKYTGGRPVLGYDVSAEIGKLKVNQSEAERVRSIFEMYLTMGSLLPVVDELCRFGWKTKSWVTRKGKLIEGLPFNKNRVHAVLTNPLYIGKVKYKDQLYDGEHEAIIEESIFEKVQEQLASNRTSGKDKKQRRPGGILNGILRCKACNSAMSHSYSKKSDGKRYRYYVCNNASKTGWKNCPHPSLPAAEIEGFILDEIRAIGLDDSLIEEVVLHTEQSIRNEIKAQKQQLSLLRKELAQADEATMAITLESIANAEKRLTALKKNNLCAQDVRDACRRFDPLWDVLSSEDQSRMLNTLLESVEFDSTTESININFAPGGVRKLSKQEVNR